MANSGRATKRSLSPEDAAALHEYLIMDFSLQLLHSSLRRGTLSGRAPSTLGLLDPILGLMVCLCVRACVCVCMHVLFRA